MTPDAKQTLCREIAASEGWEVDKKPSIVEGWWYGYPPSGEPYQRIPDYLTDAAETVRMEKSLLVGGWRPNYDPFTEQFGWYPPPAMAGVSTFRNKVYEIATAASYLAMLKEKAG